MQAIVMAVDVASTKRSATQVDFGTINYPLSTINYCLKRMPLLRILVAALALVAATAFARDFADDTDAFLLQAPDHSVVVRINPGVCAEKVAPCSTFKIWNSAIGLELGVVSDPDAPFWKWDGEKREITDWNQDQTLRSAIAVSCVPAYQALARQIGAERMQQWITRLGYGDGNISAGIDIFWLPDPPQRQTILINADEQVAMLTKLTEGKLPFSEKTRTTLKSIMKLRATDRGTFYGKTGTGSDPQGKRMGWFVGYVEASGQTYVFACRMRGERVMGKDARAATEKFLTARGLL